MRSDRTAVTSPKTAPVIPGVRKAAVLLISLGDQSSAEIIRHLRNEEIHALSSEIARIDSIPPEETLAILSEFHEVTSSGKAFMRGGVEYAEKLLVAAIGPEHAKRVMDRVAAKLVKDDPGLRTLETTGPDQLISLIQGEHPQTIALILSHLEPKTAGALLLSLPAETRGEVAMRIASLDKVSADVLSKVVEVVERKLSRFGEFSRKTCGGVRTLTDLLNQIDAGSAEKIVDGVAQTDPVLGDAIHQLRFVFEDLVGVDKEGIKVLLGKVDRKVLTMALKGTSMVLKEHFTSCMSQRGAEMLREDMEALGPVRVRDVQAAQQQVLASAKQLEEQGVMVLRATQGEQYVV